MRDYNSPLTGNDYGSSKLGLTSTSAPASEKPLQELVSRQDNLNAEYSKLLHELEDKLDNIIGGIHSEPNKAEGIPEPGCMMERYERGLRTYADLNNRLYGQIDRLRKII